MVIGCLLSLFGCQDSTQHSSDNWLLISFEKDVPVTYKMTAIRETQIDLTTGSSGKKSRPQTMSEKLEMVMVYTPIEVDPFALTTLEVTCKSANVIRSGFSRKDNTSDAVEKLLGKHFLLKLTPTGQIADYSDLERISKELGQMSFTSGKNDRRIKNPDMISDFLAMQQFLWDASATISNQLDLEIGNTWQAQQTIAWPVPMYPPPARMTSYTLENISEATVEEPRIARITSTYALSETPMEMYIRPYEEGKFQMRGLFGFLRGYQFQNLEGTGTQTFNMDDGLVESDRQQYTINVTANFMLPLGDSKPVLTVDQTFTIERIQTAD
jgi:hypothetical protein